MTDEGAKMIAESINNLAKEIETMGCRIAEDNSLGEWISSALQGMVEDIVRKGLVHTVYLKSDPGEVVNVQIFKDDTELE